MTSLQLEATPSKYGKARSHSPLEALTQDELSGLSSPRRLSLRRSLRASTLDGTFSSAFENVVRGVLISNFLLGLGAGAFEVGLLTSIPMMAHLLQPLGAYFSEKSTSRHLYCLWIYGTSRLLWLLPAAGIFLFSHGVIDAQGLSLLTLGVLTVSNILDSFGSASWMSWMAVLVPAKVRGRYFSLRKSLSSLMALLTIPAGGWIVSSWLGGEVEGYGIALIIAVVMGVISLGFQFQMSDVNPQESAEAAFKKQLAPKVTATKTVDMMSPNQDTPLLNNRNFLTLLLFLGLWTFGINLSAPFFNFYLLDTLNVDVQWVTVYSSLQYGAFFLTIMLWGRLADSIGNRPVLILNCLMTAAIPLLWFLTDSGAMALWIGFPLLHLLQGTSFAALELCLANIQLELAPLTKQSGYFAIAAAVIGLTGALGTTAGSLLAELPAVGLLLLFGISALGRLVSIVPLLLVQEKRSQSIRQIVASLWQRLPSPSQPARAKA